MSFPKHLIEGYRTFTSQRLPTEQTRYRELSERGQSPAVMVIGCCDSRVSPEVIFDAGPGELFVVRNVANLVPVYQPDGGAHGVSAALEYAVNVLRIQHIVVLGHAQCGGIRAFIDDIEPLSPGDFIGRWMAMFIKPGEVVEQRERESMQEFTIRIEKAAIHRSLENLMTFPFVRDAGGKRRAEPARRLFRRRRGLAVRARSGSEGISQRAGKKRRRDAFPSPLVGEGGSIAQSAIETGEGLAQRTDCPRIGPLIRRFAPPSRHKGRRANAMSRYAAFFFALISLRLIRHSAIWTAFSAAPLRRLSDTHHSTRPFSTVGSVRMRLI